VSDLGRNHLNSDKWLAELEQSSGRTHQGILEDLWHRSDRKSEKSPDFPG
jgi:hypothetical protein